MFSWHIHIFFLEVILEGYASVVLVDLVFVFKVFILDFKESTLFKGWLQCFFYVLTP